MNTKNFKKTVQSGFTLVELIIVIVIVGILAAVAIPKLTDTSKSAYAGVETATVGALKSAWSSAYAVKKGVLPNAVDVAAQMADPSCTATGGKISCSTTVNGVQVPVTKDGALASVFLTGAPDNATAIGSPSDITAQ
jgi:prepilin-type N-terminal cleavage/methylation domain-containing protein